MNRYYGQSIILLAFLSTFLLLGSCSKKDSAKPPFLYAYFKASKADIFSGDTVKFSDQSLGDPQNWNWSFEGGNPATSTDENPNVIYDSTGSFNVTLTVSTGARSYTKVVKNYVLVSKAINLNDHLVAYFPFNGSGADGGPNDLTIKTIGMLAFDGTDRHSNPNSAAIFDGSSALIVPDNPMLNFSTSNFSISCWIKTNQTQKMMIWQEAGANGSKDNQTWLRIGDNTTNRLIRFDVEDAGGGNIINYGNGPQSGVSDNKWHNVVCVRDGGKTRLYIDGKKVSELDKSTVKVVSNSQDFKIGTQEGPLGSFHTFFTGSLDDIRIYNKDLTDLEIDELYKQ